MMLLGVLMFEDPKPVTVKLGVLTSESPKGWVSQKPANLLRSYQFLIPSQKEGTPDVEIAIFKEASPKVAEKHVEWKATFVPPEGKTIDDVVKTSTFELPKKTKAHVLDFTGTWKYRERPRDPRSKEEMRADYRVVWVILVQEDETTHIRLSGPSPIVGANYDAFQAWLKAAK
ncbi:MAG: hypothetical protein ACRC8S_10355 [Fimbriiglobus sp.]